MKDKEKWLEENFATCPNCGYHNKNKVLERYEKCRRCDTVLDKKALCKREIIWKLGLWGKANGHR